MEPVLTTHLEKLHRWRNRFALNLDPERQHGRWLSPLLPTRRFGPAGWVCFSMATVAGQSTSGDFLSWALFGHEKVTLLAYIERPIADTFGVIGRFELSSPIVPDDAMPALGRVGGAFFANEGVDAADLERIERYLATLTDGMRDALRTAAPDFFQWASLDRTAAPMTFPPHNSSTNSSEGA